MPPASKRRRTSGNITPSSAAASTKGNASQSTLSFRSTKAGVRHPSHATKKADVATGHDSHSQTSDTIIEAEKQQQSVSEHHVPAIDIEDPSARILQYAEEDGQAAAADEENTVEAELNAQALSMSEAKIKSYWMDKERERKAPRVHQQGLTVREKVLREFDMSSRYGPSIGITRLKRWRRAYSLELEPPMEVLAILLKEEQTKGEGVGQRSIMDELIMGSRIRGENLAEA